MVRLMETRFAAARSTAEARLARDVAAAADRSDANAAQAERKRRADWDAVHECAAGRAADLLTSARRAPERAAAAGAARRRWRPGAHSATRRAPRSARPRLAPGSVRTRTASPRPARPPRSHTAAARLARRLSGGMRGAGGGGPGRTGGAARAGGLPAAPDGAQGGRGRRGRAARAAGAGPLPGRQARARPCTLALR